MISLVASVLRTIKPIFAQMRAIIIVKLKHPFLKVKRDKSPFIIN